MWYCKVWLNSGQQLYISLLIPRPIFMESLLVFLVIAFSGLVGACTYHVSRCLTDLLCMFLYVMFVHKFRICKQLHVFVCIPLRESCKFTYLYALLYRSPGEFTYKTCVDHVNVSICIHSYEEIQEICIQNPIFPMMDSIGIHLIIPACFPRQFSGLPFLRCQPSNSLDTCRLRCAGCNQRWFALQVLYSL